MNMLRAIIIGEKANDTPIYVFSLVEKDSEEKAAYVYIDVNSEVVYESFEEGFANSKKYIRFLDKSKNMDSLYEINQNQESKSILNKLNSIPNFGAAKLIYKLYEDKIEERDVGVLEKEIVELLKEKYFLKPFYFE